MSPNSGISQSLERWFPFARVIVDPLRNEDGDLRVGEDPRRLTHGPCLSRSGAEAPQLDGMTRFRSLLRLLAPLATAVGLVGCSGGSPDSSASEARAETPTAPATTITLSELRRRPLYIPQLKTGERCPVSRLRTVSPDFGPGLGDGPVYPVGFTKRSVLLFEYPPQKRSVFAGSKWSGQKVLWVSDPKYEGPILIRGHQLDGGNEVRFGHGGDLQPRGELAFESYETAGVAGGWWNFPSYTRLRAAGCYAYQVDGAGFSDVIVFRAVVY